VVNLFAYRATKPSVLFTLSKQEAIGPSNDKHICEAIYAAKLVICAWGQYGTLFGRDEEVLALLRDSGTVPLALKITASGMPAHPLYLPYGLLPKEYLV